MVDVIRTAYAGSIGVVDKITGDLQGVPQTHGVSVRTMPDHCCGIIISGPDSAVNMIYQQIEEQYGIKTDPLESMGFVR